MKVKRCCWLKIIGTSFLLRSIFISNFNVIEAVNGADGLDKALKFVPDIIISDIMMPERMVLL